MQILTNVSKYLVLALLSCSILITWHSHHNLTSLVEMQAQESTTTEDTMPAIVEQEAMEGAAARAVEAISTSNQAGMSADASTKTDSAPKANILSNDPPSKVLVKKIQAIPIKKPADSLWHIISSEFKLDHKTQTPQVQREIRRLVADPHKLQQILNAASPYLYFIHQQTKAKHLPAELALIPFIESEFNPNDRSNKGATGIWQFMSGTARELGIHIRGNYDGRRDIVASTKAALAYFKDLGQLFKGNWYLAIAAYNCGQAKVASTVRRAQSTNFWHLRLPRETQYYVPRLLAVAAIVKNPDKYGIKLPLVKNAPYFTEVRIKKSSHLEKLAKDSGINIKILNTLNPDYNRGMIPKSGVYSLLIPIDKVSALKKHLSSSEVVNT